MENPANYQLAVMALRHRGGASIDDPDVREPYIDVTKSEGNLIALGAVVGIVVLIIFVGIIAGCIYRRNRYRKQKTADDEERQLVRERVRRAAEGLPSHPWHYRERH